MRFRVIAGALCLFLLPLFLCAEPDLVIFVRHAEKEAAPQDNPSLTPAGRERAAALVQVVEVLTAKVPLRAIFTTDFARTRETAAPLAAATHIAPTVTNDDPMARIRAMRGGTVVIVGHSNTLPAFIEALGGPAGIVIGDAEFSHLFVLSAPATRQAKLASLSYGK
jgi:broad specificity phosphatase PhoE